MMNSNILVAISALVSIGIAGCSNAGVAKDAAQDKKNEIVGDFDGDGKTEPLKVDYSDSIVRVSVDLSSDEHAKVAELSLRDDMSIYAVEPGQYLDACALGYNEECEEVDDGVVTIAHDAVKVEYPETSEALYHWDGQKFVRVQLSD